MKIAIVTPEGERLPARLPHHDASACEIAACPNCKAEPCLVSGTGITHHDHDTYYARGVARCCGRDIGEIRTTVSTMFGIDEDHAVLNGRPRVY